MESSFFIDAGREKSGSEITEAEVVPDGGWLDWLRERVQQLVRLVRGEEDDSGSTGENEYVREKELLKY